MHYLPNILTLIRIGLVPVLIVLLQEKNYLLSLLVFVLAGVSDALDGFIAKQFNAKTYLGAILDPLADKTLLVASYVMLSMMNIIPFWLMVLVVFRDLVIIGGYLIMVLFFGSPQMQPLKVSKFNTFMQIFYIFLVLVSLAWGLQLETSLMVISYIVLLTSVVSGCAYVYIWSLKAMGQSPEQS